MSQAQQPQSLPTFKLKNPEALQPLNSTTLKLNNLQALLRPQA